LRRHHRCRYHCCVCPWRLSLVYIALFVMITGVFTVIIAIIVVVDGRLLFFGSSFSSFWSHGHRGRRRGVARHPYRRHFGDYCLLPLSSSSFWLSLLPIDIVRRWLLSSFWAIVFSCCLFVLSSLLFARYRCRDIVVVWWLIVLVFLFCVVCRLCCCRHRRSFVIVVIVITITCRLSFVPRHYSPLLHMSSLLPSVNCHSNNYQCYRRYRQSSSPLSVLLVADNVLYYDRLLDRETPLAAKKELIVVYRLASPLFLLFAAPFTTIINNTIHDHTRIPSEWSAKKSLLHLPPHEHRECRLISCGGGKDVLYRCKGKIDKNRENLRGDRQIMSIFQKYQERCSRDKIAQKISYRWYFRKIEKLSLTFCKTCTAYSPSGQQQPPRNNARGPSDRTAEFVRFPVDVTVIEIHYFLFSSFALHLPIGYRFRFDKLSTY